MKITSAATMMPRFALRGRFETSSIQPRKSLLVSLCTTYFPDCGRFAPATQRRRPLFLRAAEALLLRVSPTGKTKLDTVGTHLITSHCSPLNHWLRFSNLRHSLSSDS